VVDGSISGIEGSLSEIEGTLTNTKTQLESQITDAKTDLQKQLDEAREELDGLEVGGRNLLLNSGTSRKSSEYIITEYPLSKEIEHGTTVTVLFRARLGEGKAYFGLFNSGGHTTGNMVSIYRVGDVGDYALYKATFDWRIPSSNANEYLRFYHMSASVIAESEISWAKLVEGNAISTDWTPAPEDTEQKITNINQTITNIEGELSTKVEQTEVDALKGTVERQGTLLTQTA